MATYAIGDIQGCYQTFIKLLNKINFSLETDQLWLAGDLINRGPDSLKVLKFAYKNQDNVTCVLGNHDLHFLAVASGFSKSRPKDTFSDILNAKKRDKLVNWLSQQPLFYKDTKLKFAMSHAGLPPCWSVKQAEACAQEVSEMIISKHAEKFYRSMYGNIPDTWDKQLTGIERLRFITNALTRMRFCYADGSLELDFKNAPGKQPKGLIPWYELPSQNTKYQLVFGHWASLNGKCDVAGIYALDTGCVWGGRLSALRLEDQTWFSVKSIENKGT